MDRSEDVEILIHIAAPSRTSDDIRYRSLAAAYTNFQPHKIEHISGQDEAATQTGIGYLPVTSLEEASRERSFGHSFSSPVSPLASFRSVLDNANSQGRFKQPNVPIPPFHQTSASQKSAPDSSWNTPPSIVQDSVPENDATTALLTTPTRVLEHYLQNFASPSQASQNRTHRREVAVENTRISPRGKQGAASSSQERNNQLAIIPCTPEKKRPQKESLSNSVKPRTSQSSFQSIHSARETPYNSQGQEFEEEIIEDTILPIEPATPQATRADSEPPPSKRAKRDKSDASPGALLRTSSDILHNAPVSSTRSITFLPKQGDKYDRLILEAPEPPVGHEMILPEDLITPGLAQLAGDLKISKRYKPASKTRDLRPLERGYWMVDCRDWPADLKTEAWVFLANYIGKGVAGWGVSCHRDGEFTYLRLYCWGLLVAHIYFVIYLASRRRVCFSDTTWVDASSEVVIRMPKKDEIWKRY